MLDHKREIHKQYNSICMSIDFVRKQVFKYKEYAYKSERKFAKLISDSDIRLWICWRQKAKMDHYPTTYISLSLL